MTKPTAILVTLVIYKIVLILIGLWANKRTKSTSDYFLGGRKLGPWVAALSASASSSSAWTLLGVSGAAYLWGLPAIWLFPATLSGFMINWFYIAPRLSVHGAKVGAITLTDVLAKDDNGFSIKELRWLASVIILFCFVFYIASQFDAAGQSFQSTFGIDKNISIILGAGIILIYTLLGGFWAVSVSDTIQGIMMALSAIILPIVAVSQAGLGNIVASFSNQSIFSSPSGMGGIVALGFIFGTLGIGIGYPGQPHVVNRFMAIEPGEKVRQGRMIAFGWALIIYPGMIFLGWAGRILMDIAGHEQILIVMGNQLLPPVLAGIILAAVLSAIMSTADSQLLVAASSVSHDLKSSGEEFSLNQTRIVVAVICVISVFMAIFVDKSIYSRVLFAFSAMGAAFGPLLIGRMQGGVPKNNAISAMAVGFFGTLLFYYSDMKPEGNPLERLIPFSLAFIIVQMGRKKG
ncbi:MAG: sodium/proline symporter [Candidatus Marinimicrobia bacterium]|mgnify:CR=1 FL=1|nr:sodium/proline symporter [Candidatus Neomarinimicrobiota bacterium]MBT5386787.1 sodium/proline symporter [Candidatus Neomarinimicrobiota bacterium]MBT5777526.1 sodium/proline symporter [Candidatus Neomarinimicrobiota bacterium]MBT7082871.1 sodium/proline symporter [Candidatus Neomarinimicrobiota bacterium]MBT7973897.1 sodium/proline symporter [Candidatus Neomarinimicrobiota bacterium]